MSYLDLFLHCFIFAGYLAATTNANLIRVDSFNCDVLNQLPTTEETIWKSNSKKFNNFFSPKKTITHSWHKHTFVHNWNRHTEHTQAPVECKNTHIHSPLWRHNSLLNLLIFLLLLSCTHRQTLISVSGLFSWPLPVCVCVRVWLQNSLPFCCPWSDCDLP